MIFISNMPISGMMLVFVVVTMRESHLTRLVRPGDCHAIASRAVSATTRDRSTIESYSVMVICSSASNLMIALPPGDSRNSSSNSKARSLWDSRRGQLNE
jgi:hypothetical protein